MGRPLEDLAEAFNSLAAVTDNSGAMVRVDAFAHACCLVTPIIRSLGPFFTPVEQEYVSKVNDIVEASRTIATLPELVDADIENNTTETLGSHTRNLLRVKRSLEMFKVIFREVLASRDDSIIGPVWTAYNEAFSAYHGTEAQNMISYRISEIPSKSQLTRTLNEDENSARIQMQTYVTASASVIAYINDIYDSRGLGIDW